MLFLYGYLFLIWREFMKSVADSVNETRKKFAFDSRRDTPEGRFWVWLFTLLQPVLLKKKEICLLNGF